MNGFSQLDCRVGRSRLQLALLLGIHLLALGSVFMADVSTGTGFLLVIALVASLLVMLQRWASGALSGFKSLSWNSHVNHLTLVDLNGQSRNVVIIRRSSRLPWWLALRVRLEGVGGYHWLIIFRDSLNACDYRRLTVMVTQLSDVSTEASSNSPGSEQYR